MKGNDLTELTECSISDDSLALTGFPVKWERDKQFKH